MRLRVELLLLLVLVLSPAQTQAKDKEKRRGKRRRDGDDKVKRHKPLKLKLVPPPSVLIGPEPPPSDLIGSQLQGSAAIGPEDSVLELLKTEDDPQYHTEPALNEQSLPNDVVEKWEQQQKKKDEARRKKKKKRDKQKKREEQALRIQVKKEQNQWKQEEAELRKQEEAELRKQEEAELRKQEEAELRKQEEAELRKQEEAELRKQEEAELRKQEEAELRKQEEAELRKQEEAELRKQEEAELRKQEEAELRKQEEAELRKQEEAELRKQEETELRKQEEAEFRQAEEEVQVWLRGDVFEINREEETTTDFDSIKIPPTDDLPQELDYEPTKVHEEELEEVFEEPEQDSDMALDLDPGLDPSPDRGGLPQGCDISDVTVSCENAGLQHFPPLSIPELKSLILEGNNISSIPAEAFNGIPDLEWINLKKNRLTSAEIHPLAFRRLKFLTRLYLDGNLLESVPPGLPSTLQELKINENHLQGLQDTSLKGLNSLVTLELEGNRISEGGVAHGAFKDLTELWYLRLGRNHFRAVPQGLPRNLQELYLEHNWIEEISETVFNQTQSLTLISLRNNRLEESRIAPLAWIHHRSLESLDLSNNELHLVPSFLPRSLVHLVLVGNHIERIPGYVFAHMSPGLEYLYLSYNKLDGEGFEPESFFGTYQSMVELCLDHNQLLNVPSGIAEMTNLHFLRLNDNKIRTVPEESLCDPGLNTEGTLVAVRLDNNFIDPENVPPSAFSCVRTSSSVVLKPQHSTKKQPRNHD